jgi:hypothetical protein
MVSTFRDIPLVTIISLTRSSSGNASWRMLANETAL